MAFPPVAARLPDGRLHLSHGPIDLVLRAYGDARDVTRAEDAAAACFPAILPDLVAELPLLRARVGAAPQGLVARRMHAACLPFARQGLFVTAMAAVAGSVADHVLAVMLEAAPDLTRAYVNDGGDIAIHLAQGEGMAIGMVVDPRIAVADGAATIRAGDGIGGIATSGRHGRSLTLGIADAVTVLARDAASADVAATLIGNAVNLDSPAITRVPARTLDPDSDLGDLLVTTDLGALTDAEIGTALDHGAERAAAWIAQGLIAACALRLRGQARTLGPHLLENRA
jgi:hypothetical protein